MRWADPEARKEIAIAVGNDPAWAAQECVFAFMLATQRAENLKIVLAGIPERVPIMRQSLELLRQKAPALTEQVSISIVQPRQCLWGEV